jgi:hypothetical protein
MQFVNVNAQFEEDLRTIESPKTTSLTASIRELGSDAVAVRKAFQVESACKEYVALCEKWNQSAVPLLANMAVQWVRSTLVVKRGLNCLMVHVGRFLAEEKLDMWLDEHPAWKASSYKGVKSVEEMQFTGMVTADQIMCAKMRESIERSRKHFPQPWQA